VNSDDGDQPTALQHGDRSVRLKWHKLRRHADDPPFDRDNLRAGLAAGASLEVDLRRLACGRFVCLHDPRLESETTGEGPVADSDAATVARLEMRQDRGQRPLMLDELAQIVRTAKTADSARVQLDLCTPCGDIDAAARGAFASALQGLGGRFILSGHDWDAVARLGATVEGIALGYDPSDRTDAPDLVRLVRDVAPQADTIYLHRRLVRQSLARGDHMVGRLRAHGHQVDCWTIDHGTPDAADDMMAALDAGCDQITTNTACAWAAWRPDTAEAGALAGSRPRSR
jgi:glycerophosphoryl diester phosphodiesterase